MTTLIIGDIRRDSDLQPRVMMSEHVVAEYAEQMGEVLYAEIHRVLSYVLSSDPEGMAVVARSMAEAQGK